MKALVLTSTDGTLEFTSAEEPAAGPGMAVIALQAAAVNRRDFWITQGGYPNIQSPCILGSDGVGIVETVGEDVDPSWLGKQVVMYPSLDWGESQEAQGENFRILGMPDHGTFAEKISVPVQQLAEKPAHLTIHEAAALPLASLTAYRALFPQGRLQSHESILITGIGGGVATIALKMAHASGARVVVSSSSDEKLAHAMSLGASAGVNYTGENWSERFLSEHGRLDLILDGAAGSNFGALLPLVRPGGRVVSYGGTAGPSVTFPIRYHFWNQLQLIGSTMGSPSDFADMISFVEKHELRPEIDSVTPLEEGVDLISSMARSPQFGKLVLQIS
ncbi:MAG: zinc-binding dehydrogenase [Roseibacillus sp.]|nr:zinc-binding dehydrogenase [Roseibacillus sp.]